MTKTLLTSFALIISLIAAGQSIAAYNFHASTPIGSWQVREELRTNHKGKQSVSVIRSSLLSEETLSGKAHYWLEMEMQEYKVKKGKRKKKGDAIIVKSAIPKSYFDSHLGGAFNLTNVRDIANKMIIQTGEQKPVLIEGTGFLADTMLKFMGIKIDYSFTPIGKSSTEVPAGNFSCEKISAKGSGSAKVLIKRITIQSDATLCLSNKMPFGLVSSDSINIINGKKETSEAKVLEYRKTGAISKITQEPTVMSGSIMGNN